MQNIKIGLTKKNKVGSSESSKMFVQHINIW